MSLTDQAIHAIGIERDYWQERALMVEQHLAELELELAEAHQLVAAMAAEIRRAA